MEKELIKSLRGEISSLRAVIKAQEEKEKTLHKAINNLKMKLKEKK